MKIRAFVTLATAVALVLGGCDRSGGTGRERDAVLGDFPGHVRFVNYWAEWCAPCREEIPALNRFQARHPETVKVVGVNFDRVRGEELQRQEEALGVAFPTLKEDPRASLGVPPVEGLPETLVVDRDGELVMRLTGPQELEDLEQALEQVRQQSEDGS